MTNCAHHFLIERPMGPTSNGTCKHCGEERVFCNTIDEYYVAPHHSANAAKGRRRYQRERLAKSAP